MADFLIKKKSNIHGQGVFTTKLLKNGEVFYEIPTNLTSNKPKPRWAHIGDNLWVSDEQVLNYVNHSCEPNSLLDLSNKPKLVAKRDILAGEEITVDYNQTEKPQFKVECACKSKNCRNFFYIQK